MDGSCNLVLYFGTRGGGAQLLLETVDNLSKQNVYFSPLVSRELSHEAKDLILKDAIHITQIRTLREFWLNSFSFFRECFALGIRLKKCRKVRIVLVMIHPMDLALLVILKVLRIRLDIMLVVHEIESRDNHWWPSKFITNLYLNLSQSVVALNRRTYEDLLANKRCKKVYLSKLQHKNLFGKIPELNGKKPYALCIGRNEPYKDLDLLVQAWKILGEDFMNLVIRGDGVSNFSTQNVFSTNIWMSDLEFVSQIFNAELIILPYKSSTQSGVLSLALSLNRRVVITPVPELIAQACGAATIAESFTGRSLATAVTESLNSVAIKLPSEETHHIDLHELTTLFFKSQV